MDTDKYQGMPKTRVSPQAKEKKDTAGKNRGQRYVGEFKVYGRHKWRLCRLIPRSFNFVAAGYPYKTH